MDNILTSEALPSERFNIFTGILKAGGGDGEPMTLSGVASSTVEDLHGDTIERTALKDMEKQVANGLTIFLNHSYQVPEDVAGYASAAKITKRGEDGEGNAVWDLDMDITINDENTRATEAWRGIRKKGAKVGLSIGANIPPGGYDVDRKTGAKTIKHVQLLETSIVGIPANPRSWISMALKSLGAKNEPTEVMTEFDEELSALPEPDELASAPPADDRAEETSPEQPDAIQDDSELEADGDPSPEVAAAEEPSDAEEVVPLESNADPVSAAIESLDEAEGEVAATHLQLAVDIARSLADQVTVLTKERDSAVKAKDDAERERDEVVKQSHQILEGTSEIIKELGDMPVGRKAIVEEQSSKLKHLERVYGTDFMKMLEK